MSDFVIVSKKRKYEKFYVLGLVIVHLNKLLAFISRTNPVLHFQNKFILIKLQLFKKQQRVKFQILNLSIKKAIKEALTFQHYQYHINLNIIALQVSQ